jgi:hypothetical protein
MKSQFKGVTKLHVNQAIQLLKAGKKTRWGSSKKFLLMHNGVGLPPKAVLGVAACIANGVEEWDLGDFSGGEETNNVLRNLGFEVVTRQ